MTRVVPRLVGVVSALAELEALTKDVPALPVDWVEVRFDSMPEADWAAALAASKAIVDGGKGVLATIRLASDGGSHAADDAARVESFRRALDHVSAIDVEIGSVHAKALVELAHAKGKLAIVSHHDFTRTVPLDELRSIEARARATGADVVKISTMIVDLADHDSLLDLLSEHRDGSLCVIGMGELGIALRSYAPSVGSALAYAYLDRPSAPGQLSAASLGRILADHGVR